MPYNVSSSFNYLKDQYAPAGIERKFTIGSSDYTDRVIKWPSLRTVWNEPKAQTVTLQLANNDSTFNFFKTNPLTLQTSYSVSIGFNGELIEIFQGKASDISFSRGICTIRATDKLRQLENRVIGSTISPVEYTGSNYLLSDICWWSIVSYGGFDATTNSSNLDIDYLSLTSWAGVFSANATYVNAKFQGLTVLEVLRKAARMSQSAIFLRENKLFFHRFSQADSGQVNLSPSNMIGAPSIIYSDDTILNRYHTFADYDINSRYWKIDAVAANSASVNSYGLREGIEKDSIMWYVNSTSALDLSQRISGQYIEPIGQVKTKAAMSAVTLFVGEMITITDPAAELSGDIFRIKSTNLNINEFSVELEGDASFISNGFTLDTSSLDGSDVLL